MPSDRSTIAKGITMHWDVMSGTPCIAGTRITPDWVMGMFLHGRSVRKIAKDYGIAEARIENAIRFEYGLKAAKKHRPRARKPKEATK